jgi:copper chaperone CopZ
LDGVTKADVSMPSSAAVSYKPGKVTVEQMLAAVKKVGYSAKLKDK